MTLVRIACAVFMALLAPINPGCSRDATTQINRSEYRSLCRLLAAPLSHQTSKPRDTPEAILAHMTNKERELGQLAKSAPPIGPLAEQCAEALSEVTVATSKLANSPQPSGLVGLMRLGVLLDGEEPTPFVREMVADDDEARRQQSAAALELKSLADRYHAVRLGLRQVAPSVSGATVTTPPVRAEFLEIGKTPGQTTDEIKLTNVSGRALHDCLIAVGLLGAGGESRTNVHFVEEWKPDQILTAQYPSGVDVSGVRLGRTTVRNAQTFSISVWSRELSFVPK